MGKEINKTTITIEKNDKGTSISISGEGRNAQGAKKFDQGPHNLNPEDPSLPYTGDNKTHVDALIAAANVVLNDEL